MANIAGTTGNQHILHSEGTPFLELVIFREGMRGGRAAKVPLLGSRFREPHTHFLGSRLLFLQGRNEPIERAARALTACRLARRFCRWISLLAKAKAARSCPVRHACARSRRPCRKGMRTRPCERPRVPAPRSSSSA